MAEAVNVAKNERKLLKVRYLSDAKLEKAAQPGEGVEFVWKILCRGRAALPAGTSFARLEKGIKGFMNEGEGVEQGVWQHVLEEGLGIGQAVDIPLTVVCPTEGGKHRFFWAMKSPSGTKIGRKVSCVLHVQSEEGSVPKRKEKRVREKRVREKKQKVETPFSWPENVTHVFLDGNNMLYVPSRLRSLMIHHGKRRAETILDAYAQAFARLTDVPNVALVFDHSSLDEYVKDYPQGGDKHFALKCAHRAGFAIADDALVEWIAQFKQQIPEASIVCVTADRGLIERLQGSAQTIKPGSWFKYTRGLISEHNPEMKMEEGSFDDFFDKWVVVEALDDDTHKRKKTDVVPMSE